MFAVSVPALALAIVLGLFAVGAIAWLLSPRDLTIDAFTDDDAAPRTTRRGGSGVGR